MAMCCPQTQSTGSSPSLVSASSMERTGEPDSRDRVFSKKKGVLYVRTEQRRLTLSGESSVMTESHGMVLTSAWMPRSAPR